MGSSGGGEGGGGCALRKWRRSRLENLNLVCGFIWDIWVLDYRRRSDSLGLGDFRESGITVRPSFLASRPRLAYLFPSKFLNPVMVFEAFLTSCWVA